MPTRDRYAEGIPSWVDLASPDTDGSKEFYGTLFGWAATDAPAGDGAYTMFSKDGRVVAGMGQLTDEQAAAGVPPVWSTYIAVDDLDASLARANEAGAVVIAPAMEVGDTGRLAFITDPTGAAVGMWEAGTHRGAQLVNEHGSLVWNELLTDDTNAATAFYCDVFGYTVQVYEMPTGPYTAFWAEGNVEGHAAAGMMAMPSDMAGAPNHWGVYFAVDDVDAAVELATAHGAELILAPMDVAAAGRMAVIRDPQGAVLTLLVPEDPLA